MSASNQPPPQAVADLPVAATVLAAFASVAGQLGLVARAATGGVLLLCVAFVASLFLSSGVSVLFLILVLFAATAHFGVNWCRVMLLGPEALPARSLAWRPAHWRFLSFSMLLFLAMMVVSMPLTAAASVIIGMLGLADAPGTPGPGLILVLLVVSAGMLYLPARSGFLFPAIAVEEAYNLRLAWQHTAGQGLRLLAALCATCLPIAIAQFLLTAFLFKVLLGHSLSDLLAALTPPDGGAAQTAEVPPQAAPSLAAVAAYDITAVVVHFLSFAVIFSLLCLAFRTCTGWVAGSGSGTPPARTD